MTDCAEGRVEACPFNSAALEARLGGIERRLGEVADLVRTQNGRVTRLEMSAAVEHARHEEREAAAARAAQVARDTGSRVSAAISTVISVLLGALGLWLGK